MDLKHFDESLLENPSRLTSSNSNVLLTLYYGVPEAGFLRMKTVLQRLKLWREEPLTLNGQPIPYENFDSCWVWERESRKIACRTEDGRNLTVSIQKVAYASIALTCSVPEGFEVRTICGHPFCIRPPHLYLVPNEQAKELKLKKGYFPTLTAIYPTFKGNPDGYRDLPILPSQIKKAAAGTTPITRLIEVGNLIMRGGEVSHIWCSTGLKQSWESQIPGKCWRVIKQGPNDPRTARQRAHSITRIRIVHEGKAYRFGRFMYELVYGPPSEKDKNLRLTNGATCGHDDCINPAHMGFIKGGQAERDRATMKKNQMAGGSDFSFLQEEDDE